MATVNSEIILAPAFEPKWNVMTLGDVLNAEVQQPPWLVEGLVAEGGGTLVSAQPHGMKSLSMLQMCMESVLTATVWGHFKVNNVRRTLFIETEDPEWLVVQRVQQLAKGLRVPSDHAREAGFLLSRPGPFDLVRAETALMRLLEEHKPDFAVLSTLQGLLAGRDWKAQDQMADVNALLVRLSQQFCPLIVITHSPWDKRQQRAAGTITQAANFMTTCHFDKKVKGEVTFAKVKVDSKIGVEETDFELRLITEGGEVRKLVYEPRPTVKRDQILSVMKRNPKASTSEVAELTGASDRYVRKLKKECSGA